MRKLPKLGKTERYFVSDKYELYQDLYDAVRPFMREHEDIYSEFWGMNYANGEQRFKGLLFTIVRLRPKKNFDQNLRTLAAGLKPFGLKLIPDEDREVARVLTHFQ